jgi:hypothetical protein
MFRIPIHLTNQIQRPTHAMLIRHHQSRPQHLQLQVFAGDLRVAEQCDQMATRPNK